MRTCLEYDHCECRQTPFGPLTICEQQGFIVSISWTDARLQTDITCPLIKEAFSQIESYFQGKLKTFSFPFRVTAGTVFQRAVWQALQHIPYGKTISYSELAAATDRPTAVRAVGMANHYNPLAIVIPCHRVIGKNGKLTGYAGGLAVKEKLLELERCHSEEPAGA